MVGGEAVEGQLQDLDLVGVDGASGREHAAVVGEGGGDEPVGVAEVGGPAGGVEERVAEGGVAGLALGGAEPDRQVDAQDRIGVVGLGVEVEGLGVVAEGVGGGEGGERGVGGLAGVADGLGEVDGLGGVEPVAGQLADPCPGAVAAQVLERFGDLPVRAGPAGGTEILVQGVLDEGVGEVVVPGRVGELAHQGRGGGGVEDVEQLVLAMFRLARASRSRSKSRPITAASDNTRSASGPSRPTRAPITSRTLSGSADLLEGVGGDPSAGGVLGDRPGLGEVAEHLAHEERVAVGLAIHRVGETHGGVVEGVPGGGLHERHDAGVVEPGQLDARDAVLSTQRGERLEQRVGARQLAVAVGPEHEHPHRLVGRDHVAQQLQARLVGPLQVVEHEHDRLLLRHHGQQPDHRREQQVPLGVGVGRLRRRQARQPARQAPGPAGPAPNRARRRARRAASSGAWVT